LDGIGGLVKVITRTVEHITDPIKWRGEPPALTNTVQKISPKIYYAGIFNMKINIKVQDRVRVLVHPARHINGYARVSEVTEKGVRVTNMNMPFAGTYSFEFFPFDQVRKA
jgi:hypothetical protein